MFITLLPRILPIEIPLSPEQEANKLTRNSGAEVPNATIVNPIMIGLIEYAAAIDDAFSTSQSELKNNKTRPIVRSKQLKIINLPVFFVKWLKTRNI